MVGRITYWNIPRGYGFISVIQPDGTLQQHFFHVSNFKEPPVVLGGIVVFNLGDPIALGKKPQAIGVRYATPADVQASEKVEAVVDLGTDALLRAGQ
jgi:cold shock CspA family protein